MTLLLSCKAFRGSPVPSDKTQIVPHDSQAPWDLAVPRPPIATPNSAA